MEESIKGTESGSKELAAKIYELLRGYKLDSEGKAEALGAVLVSYLYDYGLTREEILSGFVRILDIVDIVEEVGACEPTLH